MSIIEETLNRLSEERARQPVSGMEPVSNGHDAGLASPAEMPGDTFNALPWSAGQARTQTGKMSRFPIYVALFAAIVSAAAWFGIQFLEGSRSRQNVQVAKVTEKPAAAASITPPAASEPVKTEAPEPVAANEPAAEKTSSVGSASVAPAVSAPAPAASAPVTVAEPAKVAVVTPPPSASTVSLKNPAPVVENKSTPVDRGVGTSEPEPTKVTKVTSDKPVVASADDGTSAKVKSSMTETSAAKAPIPGWISEGRRLLDARDASGALKAWNSGFGALPSEQRIVAVAAFYDQNAAFAALKKLEGFDNGLVVSGNYAGRNAWYVLIHAQPESRQADLARAMALTGVKGGAVTGVARINQVIPVPDQRMPSPANQNQEVKKSSLKSPAAADPVGDKEHEAGASKKDFPNPVAKKEPREQVVSTSSAPAANQAATAPAMNVLYESQIEQVAKAFNRGSYKEAEELARTLLDQNASNAGAWLWVGKTVLARGQFDEAERHLSRATEISPNLAEAWTLRGIAAQETGNHAQALKYFSETLRVQPNQPEAYFNMGYSQDALGNHSEAEVNWRRFLDIAKDKPRYAKQRVYVEQHLGGAH